MRTAPRFAILVTAAIAILSAADGANWPQWRGPAFNGSTDETDIPDLTNHEANLLWTTPLPGQGAATPIVWDDRVFISSADKESKGLLALAVDGASGKVLWQKRVGTDRKALGNNNMASPSPVTDGKIVVFHYGTGELAAFDFEGKELWSRSLMQDHGEFVIKYGYSSSPLLLGGKLYVAVMQNKEPDRYHASDRKGPLDSFLLGIDAATGKELWKRTRPTDATDESTETYITPMPFKRAGRIEVTLVGGECVTGHDPETGAEVWRWKFVPQDFMPYQRLIPSPVPSDGLLYAMRPKGRPLYALKLGAGSAPGETAVACTVAWKFDGPTSDSATPLLYRDRLYVLESDRKMMTCLDAASGAVKWQERLGGGAAWRSSPTGADGKIYCMSESGEVAVLEAGDAFKVLTRFSLGGGPTRASIAVAGEKIFVRTAEKLHAFAQKKG